MVAMMDMACCKCHKPLCVVQGVLTCENCGDANVEHPLYKQLAEEKANAPEPKPAVNLSPGAFVGSEQDRMKALEKTVTGLTDRLVRLEQAIIGRKK
jgi:uncharacterized Zn finger protein (UPF0148 family)